MDSRRQAFDNFDEIFGSVMKRNIGAVSSKQLVDHGVAKVSDIQLIISSVFSPKTHLEGGSPDCKAT